MSSPPHPLEDWFRTTQIKTPFYLLTEILFTTFCLSQQYRNDDIENSEYLHRVTHYARHSYSSIPDNSDYHCYQVRLKIGSGLLPLIRAGVPARLYIPPRSRNPHSP